MGSVTLLRQRGTVAALHALDPFADGPLADPVVWWCDPIDAAVALGSRQRPDTVDHTVCAARGIDVVRRRSGGGAVFIRPDAVVWIDLVVPHGVAPDDVRGSMVWAGRLWQDAVGGMTTVHEGALACAQGQDPRWCELVCFAGVGPGEVLLDGRKLVGLSQRRTRHGIRIQGMVHRRSLNDVALAVLAGDLPGSPLPEPALAAGLDAGSAAEALAARLGAAITPV